MHGHDGREIVEVIYQTEVALKFVRELAAELSGKIVVNSDNEECLGEYREYGHVFRRLRVDIRGLTKAPGSNWYLLGDTGG